MRSPGSLRHKNWKLPALVAAVLAVAVTGFILYKQQNKQKPSDSIANSGWTEPKELSAEEYQQSFDDTIKRLEEETAEDEYTSDIYLTLAQSYRMKGNSAKALENYELARQAADPNSEGYEEFVALMDSFIQKLKAGNNE